MHMYVTVCDASYPQKTDQQSRDRKHIDDIEDEILINCTRCGELNYAGERFVNFTMRTALLNHAL